MYSIVKQFKCNLDFEGKIKKNNRYYLKNKMVEARQHRNLRSQVQYNKIILTNIGLLAKIALHQLQKIKYDLKNSSINKYYRLLFSHIYKKNTVLIV